jgi:hypothetical protein
MSALYSLCVSECPKGETCFNYDLFHYRDYTHNVLAQIRASKGHLPQEHGQCATAETVKRVGCGSEQLSLPFTPPNSNKKLKRSCIGVSRGHPSGNQRELFNDEQAHTARKEDTFAVLLQTGGKKNAETTVRKCNVNGSYNENGNRGTADHVTEDPNLEERSNKNLKFCGENLECVIENGGSDGGSKSCIITAVDRNCQRSKEDFQEQTYAKSYSHECNHDGSRRIKTGGLPGEVESCPGCLQPAELNSCSGEAKLKFPIKVGASCGEEQWETVGIAALPDAEVADGMVSPCRRAKNSAHSQEHAVTSVSGETVMNNRKFESHLFSSVKELELPYKACQEGTSESKNHQTSITSYFKSSCQSSSLCLRVPTEGASKDVKSSNSSCAVSEDCRFFKQNDSNSSGKECVQNLSKPSKQSKCLKHRIT